ncbi:hypothetical protein AB8A05_10910 [Tardiphaga sp. 538_B7_N1_4]
MKAFFDQLSAPLEWIANQIRARPKGVLIAAAIVVIVAFVAGARWF